MRPVGSVTTSTSVLARFWSAGCVGVGVQVFPSFEPQTAAEPFAALLSSQIWPVGVTDSRGSAKPLEPGTRTVTNGPVEAPDKAAPTRTAAIPIAATRRKRIYIPPFTSDAVAPTALSKSSGVACAVEATKGTATSPPAASARSTRLRTCTKHVLPRFVTKKTFAEGHEVRL